MRPRFAAKLLICLSLSPSLAFTQATTLGLSAPRLFEKGMNALTGVGISQNDLDATDYFRRSADLGYPAAQVMMGYFYDTGFKLSQNSGDAADWYKKAGKTDDRLAEWLLGRLYYTGSGIPRDLAAAETWLQKAANQNDPYGQYLLGMVKLERNDYPAAATMFRKAAMQGLSQAQQQLGELYKQGRGVTADKFESYVWLMLSYQAGNQAVASELLELESALGTQKVEQARTKARDMQQIVSRAVVAHGCSGWPGEFNTIPVPPPPDIQVFCQ